MSTISEHFRQDHKKLDGMFSVLKRDLQLACESTITEVDLVIGCFDRFSERLDRHIAWEEDVLFPAVEEERPELKEGPGHVMRTEHEDIRNLKKSVREKLVQAKEDRSVLQSAMKDLNRILSILEEHNMKEEQIYYPMADELLSPDHVAEILLKVRHEPS